MVSKTATSQSMDTNTDTLIMSHLSLRKTIGILGFTHPFILIVGGYFIFGDAVQDSMSNYYYTGMRDVFVSITIATGLFLYAYKGYDKSEDMLGNIAFILTMGIAFLPMTPDIPNPTETQVILGNIHIISAVAFLCLLAYFCICLFTKSDERTQTPKKQLRNKIYRASGYTILATIALMSTFLFVISDELRVSLTAYHPIFWLEALSLLAFGLAWMVKGEALLADSSE